MNQVWKLLKDIQVMKTFDCIDYWEKTQGKLASEGAVLSGLLLPPQDLLGRLGLG